MILAKNKKSGEMLALKQLKREDSYNGTSFVNEIKILKKLKHENIVRFEDAFIDSWNFYIATTYCSGGPLLGW